MLQTNPMAPAETPVASGARSFMKASCPVPPPLFPMTQPSISCPRPLGGEERGRAGCTAAAQRFGVAAFEEGALREGWGGGCGGRGRKLNLHLGWLTGVLSSRQLGLHSVSIELVCAASSALSPRLGCRSDLHGNGWSSSAAAAASPLPPRAGRPGMRYAGGTRPALGESSG